MNIYNFQLMQIIRRLLKPSVLNSSKLEYVISQIKLHKQFNNIDANEHLKTL